ncbi:hypothetical protein [Bartonella raoultii]|uniref:Uncharacterized protein n=1 Tax=Bartonella raoultii TaxID=1457020 RepID=A0ABS7I8T8_9HYPH|nr:hypothetical protein [Bartonella raoultii]MBX4335842.1 hypothetical protein [Bartonella raoultii]
MSDQEIFLVIVIITIGGGIIYGLWKGIEKSWNAGFGDTILFIILIGALWYFESSMKTLLIVATIAFFIESLMLAFANYQNKQCNEALKQWEKFEQLCGREIAIYREIIAQWEEKLFEKNQKIPKKWIKQWDEAIRHWERSILEIKNIGHIIGAGGQKYPMVVEDICAQGYADTFFLYKQALQVEFTAEQVKRFNKLMSRPIFRKTYRKVVRLMKQNGIPLQKFVDPLTKKKRYKFTMLFLHWWVYMIDDMITAAYEKQQKDKASGHYEELASMEIYFEDIPKYTEYEALKKLQNGFGNLPCRSLYVCKRELLSFLYDVSSDYKKARETFIYYKMLIDTVKEGYIAFDKDYSDFEVEEEMKVCRKRDREEKKDLDICEKMPTFEEAYKLGVKEWMRVSNKKCDNRLIFWKMLLIIGSSKEKLKIIFGDETLKALEEAVKKDKEQVENEMQAAVFENKKFCYYKSRGHFIGYLNNSQ